MKVTVDNKIRAHHLWNTNLRCHALLIICKPPANLKTKSLRVMGNLRNRKKNCDYRFWIFSSDKNFLWTKKIKECIAWCRGAHWHSGLLKVFYVCLTRPASLKANIQPCLSVYQRVYARLTVLVQKISQWKLFSCNICAKQVSKFDWNATDNMLAVVVKKPLRTRVNSCRFLEGTINRKTYTREGQSHFRSWFDFSSFGYWCIMKVRKSLEIIHCCLDFIKFLVLTFFCYGCSPIKWSWFETLLVKGTRGKAKFQDFGP